MNEKNQAALREDSAKKAGLYVAFELSLKKWKLGFSDGKTLRARVVTIEARDWKRVKEGIEKARERFGLEKDAPVRSCYEAGREGFWIHRALVDSILAGRTGCVECGEGAQRRSRGQPADASGDRGAEAGAGTASGSDPI